MNALAEPGRPSVVPHIDESDFRKLQLQQAIDTYRAQYSLMIQLITVLLLANVTVVGYGITARSAGLVLVGSCLPLAVFGVVSHTFRLMRAPLYTAVSIEQEFYSAHLDGLMSAFLSSEHSPDYVAELQRIAAIDDVPQRRRELKGLKSPRVAMGFPDWALIVAGLGQMVAGCLLTTAQGWRLF